MNKHQIRQAAWKKLLSGAESVAEDWLDEEGEFGEEDYTKVFNEQFALLRHLRKAGPPEVGCELR